MKYFMLAWACSCMACTVSSAETWVETFDNGLGRFTVSTGDPAAFLHDPADQDLATVFTRRDPATSPDHDRLLAPLDRSYGSADVFGMMLEFTPLGATGDFPWPEIGFFSNDPTQPVGLLRIRSAQQAVQVQNYEARWFTNSGLHDIFNPGGGSNDIDWQFDQTYRLELLIDGPANELTVRQSVLVGGAFQPDGEAVIALPASAFDLPIAHIGFSNILDNQLAGSALTAEFDNVTFVPEPTSLLVLLGLSLPVAVRRSRG